MIVVPGGGGEPITGASLIGRAEWSGGDVCVLEQTVPPGVLVAAHRHSRETQGAYIVSGEISFYVDGEEATVAAGGYVVRPAGAVHSLWNATSAPARMIEITAPATEWQAFALELQRFHESEGGDPDALVALAAKYGTALEPDVTRDLCARHGVNTGAGYSVR
jgi:mannose-6-phosphate isomerase-like protein (cupin superfamily)